MAEPLCTNLTHDNQISNKEGILINLDGKNNKMYNMYAPFMSIPQV